MKRSGVTRRVLLLLATISLFSSGISMAPSAAVAQENTQSATGETTEQISPNIRDVTPQGVYRGEDWRSMVVRRLPPLKQTHDAAVSQENGTSMMGTAQTGTIAQNAVDTGQASAGANTNGEASKGEILWKRPVILSTGTIVSPGSLDGKYGAVQISFAGIKALDNNATCRGSTSKRVWNCGRFARGALLRLIRSRSIHCPAKFSGEHKDRMTVICFIDSRNISLWLVANGWAMPQEEIADEKLKNALTEALAKAKSDALGQWGQDAPQL